MGLKHYSPLKNQIGNLKAHFQALKAHCETWMLSFESCLTHCGARGGLKAPLNFDWLAC